MIKGIHGMQLVLTPGYVKEIKSLPEDFVSIEAAFTDVSSLQF